jgi:heme exporter protein C
MRVTDTTVTQRVSNSSLKNTITLVMLAIGGVLTTIDFVLAFFYTPIVYGAGVGGSRTIGGVVVSQQLLFSQKIFYFHVPVAIGSFLVFTFAMVYAVLFLVKKRADYDARSRIGMEVTLLLVILTLITGDIWTRFEWGVWWAFGEPRLTTYAIMALLVVGYFVLRAAVSDDERRATYGAVFCIIAWIDAPISFVITRMIPTSIHPVVLRAGGGLTGMQLLAFLLGLFGMLFTSYAIYQLRVREEFAKQRIDALKEALEG